jgi:hypothetical protein
MRWWLACQSEGFCSVRDNECHVRKLVPVSEFTATIAKIARHISIFRLVFTAAIRLSLAQPWKLTVAQSR